MKFDKPIRRLAPTVEAWPTQTDTDTFNFVFSNEKVGRDGFIVQNRAIKHANFDRNPVVLFAHDDKQPPIGRGTNIDTNGPNCTIDITFAPRDILPFAGTIRDLVAGKWLRAVSLSWQPVEYKRSGDPDIMAIFTEVDMLECSIVPLPALPDALLDARSHGVDTAPLYQWAERLLDKGGMSMIPRDELETLRRAAKMPAAKQRASDSADWKVGAAKDLPIEDSDSWDGPVAEKSIFEWAGGDEFDSAKARQGFLVYNAAEPDKRGSYKLPIAHAVDGELKVPKSALRAAASRISQTDIPEDVKTRAEAVLKAYEKSAGIGTDGKESEASRALKAKHARALKRAPQMPKFNRGLYDVAQLAHMLEHFGYMHTASEYEAAVEGDDSKVPAMLGEGLAQLGATLIAMTQEEVEELLDGKDLELDEPDVTIIKIEERAYVEAAKTPRSRAWRSGIALARAGKALSASNKEKLEEADAHCDRAVKHHREMGDHHDAVGAHVGAAQASCERTTQTLAELGEHVRAAQANPAKSGDHLEAAAKAHGEAEKHMGDVARAHQGAEDSHADADDCHRSLGRRIKGVQRCVRAVLSGAVTSDADDIGADDLKNQQASKEEKARAARAARALELTRRDPITLTLD